MRNVTILVGSVFLLASAGAHGAMWNAGGWHGPTAFPWSGQVASGDLWPLQVSTIVSPLGNGGTQGPLVSVPWHHDTALMPLQLDYSYAASWKLTQPDGNIWEHDVSWSGTSTLPLPSVSGSGWLISTTIITSLLPSLEPQPPAAVPLPATALLFPVGLGMLALVRRMRSVNPG